MKLMVLIILVIASLAGASNPASAAVMGRRFAGIEAGYVNIGDRRITDVFDSAAMYTAKMRLPITGNFDMAASIGRGQSDGELGARMRETSAATLIQYHSGGEERLNPYIGAGVQWVDTELRSGGQTRTRDDFGFALGGGIEYSINKSVSITGGINYVKIDRHDDTVLGAALNAWIFEKLLLTAGAKYGVDSENMGVSIGLSLPF